MYKLIVSVKKSLNSETVNIKHCSEYFNMLNNMSKDYNKIKDNKVKLKKDEIDNIQNVIDIAIKYINCQKLICKKYTETKIKKKKEVTKEVTKELAIQNAIIVSKNAANFATYIARKAECESVYCELKQVINGILKAINMVVFMLIMNSIRTINTSIVVSYKSKELCLKEVRILKSDFISLDFNFDTIEDYSTIDLKNIIRVINFEKAHIYNVNKETILKNIMSVLPDTRTQVSCDRKSYFGININRRSTVMKKSDIQVLDITSTFDNKILKLGKLDSTFFLLEGGTSKDYYLSKNKELFTIYLINEEPFSLIMLTTDDIHIDDSSQKVTKSNEMINVIKKMIYQSKRTHYTEPRRSEPRRLEPRRSEPRRSEPRRLEPRRSSIFGKRLPVPSMRKSESVDTDSLMKRVMELNAEYSKIEDNRKKKGEILKIDILLEQLVKIPITKQEILIKEFKDFKDILLKIDILSIKFKFQFKNIYEKIERSTSQKCKNINKCLVEIKKILSKKIYYSNYEKIFKSF